MYCICIQYAYRHSMMQYVKSNVLVCVDGGILQKIRNYVGRRNPSEDT